MWKSGKKPRPVDEKQKMADDVRLGEQWEVQYAEWQALVRAVKRNGRTQTLPNGRRIANPEVGMRDASARQLLATSKAKAAIVGLSAKEKAEVVVLDGWLKERNGG